VRRDAVYAHLQVNGVKSEKPNIAWYGMKQLYLRDPEGYGLCFQRKTGKQTTEEQHGDYRIDVQGDVITVSLNGVNTAQYTNTDPNRGRFLGGRTNICWVAVIFELQLHDCLPKRSGYRPLMFLRACPHFGDRAPLALFDANDFGGRAERVPRNLGPIWVQ